MTTPVAPGDPGFAFALYGGQPYGGGDIVNDLLAHLAALGEDPALRPTLARRFRGDTRWFNAFVSSLQTATYDFIGIGDDQPRPERLAIFNTRVEAAIDHLEPHVWETDIYGEVEYRPEIPQAGDLLTLLSLVAYEHHRDRSVAWMTREVGYMLGSPLISEAHGALALGLATNPQDVRLPVQYDCRRDTAIARGRLVRDRGRQPAEPAVQVVDEACQDDTARVVVASLDHLPKASSFSRERRDSPAAEFGPIAERALPLVADPSWDLLQRARAELLAEAPWASEAIDVLLRDAVGRPFLQFRPTLVFGPPGTGKSRLAHRLATLLGLPVTIFSAAGVADGAFGGTSRQWGSGRASVPLQAIRRAMIANPVMVIDEIEKAGTRSDNGRLWDSVIPMLEPETSARVFDPYLECPVDLSAVSYLATANGLAGIPGPLRDRFRVLEIPAPGPEHLPVIVRTMAAEIRAERGTDSSWLPDLDGDELGLIAESWRGGSMRALRRMVATLLTGRETLAARH